MVFYGGVFAQHGHSAGTAPIITLFIPGTPLQTNPPYRSVRDPFKTASGVQSSGPWDPWQASDYNKNNPRCTSRGAVGCRIQDPGTRGYRWWKTAHFSHSVCTAPIITLFIPGTPLQTPPPPYRSVHDPFKTASVQNSGPWDPWLPGVENSRLFAQRTVRPL